MLKSEKAAVFLIGCVGYGVIELLWRGRTHWTMMVTGGVCLLTLFQAERRWKNEMLVLRCLKGAVLITCLEFIVGVLVNKVLKWNVWDYSQLPGNLMGQVCPLYFILWYFLCYPVYLLTGLLRRSFGAKTAD